LARTTPYLIGCCLMILWRAFWGNKKLLLQQRKDNATSVRFRNAGLNGKGFTSTCLSADEMQLKMSIQLSFKNPSSGTIWLIVYLSNTIRLLCNIIWILNRPIAVLYFFYSLIRTCNLCSTRICRLIFLPISSSLLVTSSRVSGLLNCVTTDFGRKSWENIHFT